MKFKVGDKGRLNPNMDYSNIGLIGSHYKQLFCNNFVITGNYDTDEIGNDGTVYDDIFVVALITDTSFFEDEELWVPQQFFMKIKKNT